MLHSKHIVLLPGMTEATSTKTTFLVNQGMISNIWVNFPPGCAGLVKFRIYHEGHPFLPVENDAYISGDGTVFNYPIRYEITDAPEQITIESWNEDDTYAHTLSFQFLILPRRDVVPAGATEAILLGLKSLFVRR